MINSDLRFDAPDCARKDLFAYVASFRNSPLTDAEILADLKEIRAELKGERKDLSVLYD